MVWSCDDLPSNPDEALKGVRGGELLLETGLVCRLGEPKSGGGVADLLGTGDFSIFRPRSREEALRVRPRPPAVPVEEAEGAFASSGGAEPMPAILVFADQNCCARGEAGAPTCGLEVVRV